MGRAVVALERVPGAESGRVLDAVHEENPIQVVDFVLEGAGAEPPHLALDRRPLAIPCVHPHPHPTHRGPLVRAR